MRGWHKNGGCGCQNGVCTPQTKSIFVDDWKMELTFHECRIDKNICMDHSCPPGSLVSPKRVVGCRGVGVDMLRGRGIPLLDNKKLQSFKVQKFKIPMFYFQRSKLQPLKHQHFKSFGFNKTFVWNTHFPTLSIFEILIFPQIVFIGMI